MTLDRYSPAVGITLAHQLINDPALTLGKAYRSGEAWIKEVLLTAHRHDEVALAAINKWLFSADELPEPLTEAETQKLNDVCAPIGIGIWFAQARGEQEAKSDVERRRAQGKARMDAERVKTAMLEIWDAYLKHKRPDVSISGVLPAIAADLGIGESAVRRRVTGCIEERAKGLLSGHRGLVESSELPALVVAEAMQELILSECDAQRLLKRLISPQSYRGPGRPPRAK